MSGDVYINLKIKKIVEKVSWEVKKKKNLNQKNWKQIQ